MLDGLQFGALLADKKDAGRVFALIDIQLPRSDQPARPESFSYSLNRDRLRKTRRREGRYLLRTNLSDKDPARLWLYYIQLTEIEQAFKELKGDLAIRPVYHQLDHRIEAHIFVAFVAYCLQVTLKQRLRALAPGLTPRAVLEKLSTMQDGRCSSANHRPPHHRTDAIHTTGQGSAAIAAASEAETAAATTAENHQRKPNKRLNQPASCSADFLNPIQQNQWVRQRKSTEPLKTG